MKKFIPVIILLFLSVLFYRGGLLEKAQTAGVLILQSFEGTQKGSPDIGWQQHKLQKTIFQGDTVSEDFGFISEKDLEDVSVWITPEIENYVIIRPSYFDQISAGSVVRIQAIITVPDNLEPGEYNGTVHLRAGNRTLARPLPVIITVQPEAPPPVQTEIFYDDGTAEAFDFDPVHGRAVFSSKFSVGSEPVRLNQVKVFLKVPTQPASPIDIYIWDFDRNLIIPPISFTPEIVSDPSGEFFLVDVSSYDLIMTNEFYFGVAWPSYEAPPLLGVDLGSPQGQSYVVILSNDIFIPITNANLMIRALVQEL